MATDFAAFLGIAADRGIARMMPGETAMGRPGVMHGGAIATLLEQAGRAAVAAAIDAAGEEGRPAIMLASMTVDYLRVGPMAEAQAAGTIVKLGARVAVVMASAWAGDPGKPFAAAKLTFLLVRRPTAQTV